jgi:hypothetical protein
MDLGLKVFLSFFLSFFFFRLRVCSETTPKSLNTREQGTQIENFMNIHICISRVLLFQIVL